MKARVLLGTLVLAFGITQIAGAGCLPAHRHYRGKIFYLTCNEYHPPVWCDACGTSLWSYNENGRVVKVRARTLVQREDVGAVTEIRTPPATLR